MATNERRRVLEAAIAKAGLPPAPGPVIDARFIMSSGDWWVKTKAGWFWLDPRQRTTWVAAPLGPP